MSQDYLLGQGVSYVPFHSIPQRLYLIKKYFGFPRIEERPRKTNETGIYRERSGRDRRKSLHVCCLVSRSWRAVAQPCLFSCVVLSPGKKFDLFVGTLSTCPELGRWVETCSIQGDLEDPAPEFATGLDSIKKHLTRLRQLGILQSSRWKDINAKIDKTLPTLLSCGTLRVLCLDSISDLPLRLLRYSRALEELVICSCSFKEDTSMLSNAQPEWDPRPRLLSLALSANSPGDAIPLLDWLASADRPFDLSQFKKLWVWDHSDTPDIYDTVCRFVPIVASTLEDILIDPPFTRT